MQRLDFSTNFFLIFFRFFSVFFYSVIIKTKRKILRLSKLKDIVGISDLVD